MHWQLEWYRDVRVGGGEVQGMMAKGNENRYTDGQTDTLSNTLLVKMISGFVGMLQWGSDVKKDGNRWWKWMHWLTDKHWAVQTIAGCSSRQEKNDSLGSAV